MQQIIVFFSSLRCQTHKILCNKLCFEQCEPCSEIVKYDFDCGHSFSKVCDDEPLTCFICGDKCGEINDLMAKMSIDETCLE